MTKTNIGELNLTVGLDVSYDTAYICTRLLEMYLNRQPDKTLKVCCDECGNCGESEFINEMFSYCPWCGKKIDWSDENE